MDVVGERPLHINDYDKAVLAIRDGELEAFKKLLPDLQDRADELLVKTAERPGIVGRKMTLLMLEQHTDFLPGIYRATCLKAVDIADMEKTMFLLEQAQSHVRDFPIELYGAIAEYAYRERPTIAKEIIDRCTSEQAEAMLCGLLYAAILQNDFRTANKLTERGLDFGQFQDWAEGHGIELSQNDVYAQLEERWNTAHGHQELDNGGMQMN